MAVAGRLVKAHVDLGFSFFLFPEMLAELCKFIENNRKIIKRKMRTFWNPHGVYYAVVY